MADLELRQDGDVVWATMNRPERLNALSRNLVTELREFFVGLYWRRDVRVVVLQGAGDAFCAGLDLKERGDPQGARSIGAGLTRQREISEIVIATPRARMNAAFIRIGLTACDIGVSYFLPRMVGSSVAAEYMLTGRFIDAERAYQLGLISRIVAKDQLEAEAQGFVDDMLHATPLGLRLTKEALNHAIDAQGLEAVIAMEDRNQILASSDGDFQEGVMAFLEKRKPNYAKREG